MKTKDAPPFVLDKAEDQLILFYHSHNFHSQKVLFALHQKAIEFIKYEVDISQGEQFSDWFLSLTPKGDLPILKKGSLVIPEAAQIINFIENNCTDESHPSLLPSSKDADVTRILEYSRLISRLPIGAIAKASFVYYDEYKFDAKVPFMSPAREFFLKSDERLLNTIKEWAGKTTKFQDVLLQRAESLQKSKLLDKSQFENVLKKINEIMDTFEDHLKTESNIWLYSNQVSILDVCFGIFLQRLYLLGMDIVLWSNGKRPFINKYFGEIQKLDSFQRSVPNQMANLKLYWTKVPETYKYAGVGVISVSCVVLAAIARS